MDVSGELLKEVAQYAAVACSTQWQDPSLDNDCVLTSNSCNVVLIAEQRPVPAPSDLFCELSSRLSEMQIVSFRVPAPSQFHGPFHLFQQLLRALPADVNASAEPGEPITQQFIHRVMVPAEWDDRCAVESYLRFTRVDEELSPDATVGLIQCMSIYLINRLKRWRGAAAILIEDINLYDTWSISFIAHLARELVLGNIQFVSSELLQPGDVHPITPGDGLIHSLFHLERPSLSLVIRTKAREHLQPQYRYVRPWLAIDPFYRPEPFMTQLRVLESLKQTNSPLLWHFVSSMIEHSTPGMLHTVLTSLYHRYRGRSEWKQLLVLATDRFGCLVDQLVPCLEEQEREIKIVARREKVHDSVHRFFLALLLNVPNRPSIYRLIKERFPDSDPEQLVLRWVREMAEQKLLGLDFNEVSLHLLECALRQCDFIGAKASLARAFRLKNTQEESEQLLNLWNELLAAVALRPLFDEGREAATRSPSADESVVCHTRHDPSRQTLQPSGMRTMEMHNSLTQPERSSGPAPQGFRENGYAVLRNSIETRMAGGLYRYVRTRAEQRCIRPDSQVPDSPAAYADPNMEMLLVKFRP